MLPSLPHSRSPGILLQKQAALGKHFCLECMYAQCSDAGITVMEIDIKKETRYVFCWNFRSKLSPYLSALDL